MTERRALWFALGLHLLLAGVEIVAGFWARSVALLVDAADFLEDSVIYTLALRLGGAQKVDERRYGLLIAGLMAVPGSIAIWQLAQRYLNSDVPEGTTIWVVSSIALTANLLSALFIGLARKSRGQEASFGLRAAWLSSRNDALANIAMIGAGVAVAGLQSAWPDTIVGFGVAALHFSGAVTVARLALSHERNHD